MNNYTIIPSDEILFIVGFMVSFTVNNKMKVELEILI